MPQLTIQQAFDLALQHHHAGRLGEAEQLYRQIIAQQPGHVDALHHLGVIAHQAGRNDNAVALIGRAIALNPNWPKAHNNLGLALAGNGQLDEAIAVYRRAISLSPDLPEARYNLGNALRDKGQLDEAIAAYHQAIALNPSDAKAHSNLGIALVDKRQFDEAIAAYRQAIVLRPNDAQVRYNLGIALAGKGLLDESIAAYRQAIALNPSHAEAHSNLGNVLKDRGQLDEAVSSHRQAVAFAPGNASIASNLVFTLYFHPGYNAGMIHDELSQWNRRHGEPLRKFIPVHANNRDPNRRLRIGYVSPDFRDHCQSLFMVPLLSAHDHQQVEIFCYSDVVIPDAHTRQLQGHANVWRNIVGQSDEQVAALIQQDQIDILVDLTMHMARNRLLVFVRKPAPVQVCWLAYPGSTGLTAIDYRLSDPYLDPPGMDESVYSEQTIRLPDSFWCYDPLDGRDIPVNSLPALESGIVTFGCLNNFCKINDGVLTLWAQVLRQVEGSRLLLLAPQGSVRQRTLDRLCQEGIDPARVEFVPFQPRRKYLEVYHRIDMGLDSFPSNGHTTSLDSLWMGVPVVTLVGQMPVSRAGWCQVSNLGLTELAAHDPEQFIKIAMDLAKDLPRLKELRSTLRARMEQSPLMDAKKFARNIEAAYRRMWRNWCL